MATQIGDMTMDQLYTHLAKLTQQQLASQVGDISSSYYSARQGINALPDMPVENPRLPRDIAADATGRDLSAIYADPAMRRAYAQDFRAASAGASWEAGQKAADTLQSLLQNQLEFQQQKELAASGTTAKDDTYWRDVVPQIVAQITSWKGQTDPLTGRPISIPFSQARARLGSVLAGYPDMPVTYRQAIWAAFWQQFQQPAPGAGGAGGPTQAQMAGAIGGAPGWAQSAIGEQAATKYGYRAPAPAGDGGGGLLGLLQHPQRSALRGLSALGRWIA
jgi:hypothetical protein